MYPTSQLREDTVLRTSESSEALVTGTDRLPITSGYWPLLEGNFAAVLVKHVVEAEKLGRTVTLSELRGAAITNGCKDKDWLARHVLWVTKHGFLRLDTPSV
jgi:hypothetical protein